MLLVSFALLGEGGRREWESQHCPWAASRMIDDHTPGAGEVAGAEGREVSSDLELSRVLHDHSDSGQQQDIRDESRQYFSVCGAPEFLNQIDDALQ